MVRLSKPATALGGRRQAQLGRWLRSLPLLAVVVGVSGTAAAQFNPYTQLPSEDFIWTWGRRIPELEDRRFEDIDVRGNEAAFRCRLQAKLSPGSIMSDNEVRQLENDLQTNLFFVQAVANAMYYLDQCFDLDWAVLDCDKYQDDPDEATQQERENKAREKAERARERRRSRQEE